MVYTFLHTTVNTLVITLKWLETLSTCEKENPKKIIVCDDLNSRIGIVTQLNGYPYQENSDINVNQHGRRLLEICESNQLIPLNNLMKDSIEFPGGFTFQRGN